MPDWQMSVYLEFATHWNWKVKNTLTFASSGINSIGLFLYLFKHSSLSFSDATKFTFSEASSGAT